ncbi:MAG: hypothetical protein LBT98_04570, partial [Puniceicoccales bacterium]|nr:hypothetical protein [Puniceicoccales bacterium]
MLDNITKTETTRARIYLIGGIALAVLGVILSLAMIASVVFLCLTLGGVMVLPTAVTVILLVVSSTTLLIGLIGLISTGACLWPGWMGGCGGGGGGGAAMIGCAILVMIVIVGAVSPAICGICLLCAACGHFKNLPKVIEERRIQKLLYEMKSDLLWQDSDAYVIAYLTLATGLDPEMIQNLRWNQIRNDGEAIMLKTKTHNKMEIDCDLQIPLEPGKKFLVKGNDEGPVFTKERFEISYYAFINWMQCHHFDTPIAVNHIREDKGRFRWTRETVNFSSINIPQNTNLPAGQCDARFYHTINHTLRYQDPSAFIIFLLVFCYGLRVKEIESL